MKKFFLAVLAAFATTQINGTTNVNEPQKRSNFNPDNPFNLKAWDVDGLTVYAATKKAADKKAGKLRISMV